MPLPQLCLGLCERARHTQVMVAGRGLSWHSQCCFYCKPCVGWLAILGPSCWETSPRVARWFCWRKAYVASAANEEGIFGSTSHPRPSYVRFFTSTTLARIFAYALCWQAPILRG